MTSFNSEQELFKSLVEASPIPTAVYIGKDITIVAANQGMLKLWDKDASLIGLPVREAFPAASLQNLTAKLEQVSHSGINYHQENETVAFMIAGSPEGLHFSHTINILKDAAGNQTGMIQTLTDTTELVLARQKIADAEADLSSARTEEMKIKTELQRLGRMVDISEDFCNYCDLEGNTIYLNAAGLKLIGMDKKRMKSSNLFQYHSATSVQTIRDIIMPQLLRTGKWSGKLELTHQQTGEVIPIHKQFFIIREDITDRPIAIAGIARDLRPEVKAGKALDYKNTQLQIAIRELEFLANSVPVVVWTSDPQGQLDYINQRWYEKSPLPVKRALGNGWADTIHPEDEKRAWAAWRECLKTGIPYQIEFRLLDKFGEYRWWMVRAIALKDDNQHIIKWYGSNIDITEQKELEKQKDNFLGVASHELKTPVTSIKAYAQVMEMMFRRAGDTKNAELLAKMDNQVNRLSNLIGDLLEVTKINTGRLQLTLTKFSFNQMVEEVIEEVQRTALNHAIHKQLDFDREITGDKERICQVIINLLTNAIKYSPDSDHIILSTSGNEHQLQLSVQDFGIGIRADQQPRVFEQFYRVSGSREHTFPGLGLGLYISAEIIKHLNGKIWVDSAEGKGSTFCFSLPLLNQQ
ncbi:PAS domain-containing protein [Pedobacter sp. MC2016-15]|uniref:ATP-binding protein n=1 Tax=Pedobacter sp. MC2016-15 TaxID=2994473 RepID=UPI0022466236|nr:ATP-binding protein [Pedobacter sp. MC2016-15]MCX2477633.1 PAS domain-containing protein [Pedobacter sp. MC2016-15]